jgi:hypothetical protein
LQAVTGLPVLLQKHILRIKRPFESFRKVFFPSYLVEYVCMLHTLADVEEKSQALAAFSVSYSSLLRSSHTRRLE